MSNLSSDSGAPAATILQLFREKRADRQRLRPEDRLCWICCTETGVVSVDGGKELCLFCGCELVMDVLLPRVEPVLGSVELAVADELMLVEDREKRGLGEPSPPDSPKVASAPPMPPPEWSCCRCTLLNSSDDPTCVACGAPQPLLPECPHCGKDYTVKVLCVGLKPHKKWKCGHCDSENIEELVECRGCRRPRTWFCAQCSMENPMGEDRCVACEGRQHLSSLKSFVNRDMMSREGLSVREMENERRMIQEASEHRERLEHRIGCLQKARPVGISDDGNCLFRALAFQLLRDDTLYPLVRHIVVEHLVSNADHYSAFVGEAAFAKYVAGMRQAQVWGDELCVHAASRAFPNLKIHVITSDEKRWRLVYAKVKEAPSARNITLAYRAPNHYYTVAPVKDASVPPLDLLHLLNGLAADAAIASHIKITLQATLPSVVPMLKRGPGTEQEQREATSSSKVAAAGAVGRPERPSTASRGSRSGDFLQLPLIGMLDHAVVVTVRMGRDTSMALCVGGELRRPDTVTVSQKSSFFYLHHVARETILLAGTGGPFASVYHAVLAETAPQRATAPPPGSSTITRSMTPVASKQHPIFLLQDVSSGTFVGYHRSSVVQYQWGGATRSVAPLCCHHPADLSDCLLTIAEPRTASTNELRFFRYSSETPAVPQYICETGKDGEIIAMDTPTVPTPILVQLIFAGRCERLCVKCHQWFISDAAGNDVHAGGCRHVSHADAIATALKV
jgi:hypothetical protein